MKKMLPFLLSFLFCLLQYMNTANAQCSLTNTISGTACTGHTLTANVSATPCAIAWQQNGNTVHTEYPENWNGIGTTVAGGNGFGSGANQFGNQTQYSTASAGGIAVDADGNIYICDNPNNRVQKWAPGAPSGTTVAGGNGAGSGADQLNNPSDVFVDATGNIYVCDYFNARIQKWAPGATSGITVAGGNNFGSAANQFTNAFQIFVDASGNVYVSDNGNYRIQKWAPGATSGTTVAGGNGSGSADNQLGYANFIFVDGSGNLYIADYFNNRVQKWAPGATSGITIANLTAPRAIYVDAGGSMLVSSAGFNGNDRISLWHPGQSSGKTLMGKIDYSSDPNPFQTVSDMTLDYNGNIILIDAFNFRVQKFNVGNVTNTFIPSAPGNYQAVAYSFGTGCGVTSNTITVEPAPVVTSSANGALCGGSSVTLTATGGSTFTWQPGNLSGAEQTFVPLNTSTYSVTGNVNACVTEATINVLPTPEISVTGEACTGHLLTASVNSIPALLEWKLNGSVVKSSTPSWNPTAVTVAGGNGSGSGSNQFANTYAGILVDAAGNIYVSDAGNHRVQKWAPGATFGLTVAGGNGQGSADNQLYNPGGIFLDASGNLYIADQSNNRIQKWAPGAGSGTTVAGGNGFGGALNQLEYPSYVSVDESGNVYVLDGWDNARVMKWAPGATEGVVVAGGNGKGNAENQINLGTGMVRDNTGNIYVTDWYANRIQKWTPGATTGITIVSGLSSPNGLLLDGAGNFYVVNSPYVSPAYQSHIVRYRTGDYTWQDIIPATYGTAPNQLAGATNGYFDAAGNMYILDGVNRRIQRFSTAAISQTYASTSPGNYSVVATSFSGCQTTSNTINAILSPVTNSQSVSICAGSSGQLSVTGSSSYTWNPGNLSGSSISVNPSSTVTYTVTDNATSCTTQLMAFVAESSAPAISGTSCIDGTNLTGTVAKTPVTLEWKLNGSTVASSTATYSNNNMTVVAGGNGIGANLNQTKYPRGMALDVAGNVYVSEEQNHRVTKWAPGATEGVIVAGGNGSGSNANQFSSPEGIFVDKFNNIYVADQNNQRIQKWAPGATEGVTVAGGHGQGNALNQLSSPLSVYVDDAGNIYVPDQSNHRVVKWTPGALEGIVVAGGNGQGSSANQLYFPLQVTLDLQGNLYIADYSNHRIQKWAPGATSGTTVAGGNGAGFNSDQVGQPQGVAVDGAGNIYALSGYNSYITKWAPGATSGVYLAGYCCNPPGGVWGAYSLQADVSGNLYVADYVNCRVVRYNASLNIPALTPTVAGDYTLAATQFNGCVSSSPIHTVYGVAAITFTGNQYFCTGNSTTLDAGTHSTYQWSTGANTQTETFSSEGNYAVTVTDNGCSSTKNFSIAAQTPVVNTTANPAASCIGSPVQLTSSLISGGIQKVTKIYDIDVSHLIGMFSTCDNANRYGYYYNSVGFNYNDIGGGTIASIKIEFNVGLDQNVAGTHTISGAATGSFLVPNVFAGCDVANPANFVTINATPAGYNVGGNNNIYFSNPYIFGLVPTAALNNYYARVTVTYNQPVVSYAWSPNNDTIPNPVVHPLSATTYTLTASSLGCSSTSTVNVSVATAPGDTALFGDHVWNVYAFNAGDFSDTGHSWNEAYSGYYVDNNLNFNTESKWSSGSSPSNAAGYVGCAVNNDNHSWSAKRKGFPCGTYLIDVPSHDDEAQLFINGVKVWEHIGANDYHANVWTGFLDDNSNVEFRVTEGAGNSFGSITITPQALITVNGPVKFCPGYSVQLTASSAGSYLWSTGETTQTISVNATGNYSVDMTTNGCTNTASQTITVAPLDTAIIYSNKSPDFSFCPSMNTIDLRTLFKPGITRTWSNGSHSTAIFPSVPGNYSLTISDVLGCTATSHVTVTSAVAGVDSSFGDNAWKVNAYSQGYYTEYYGYYTYGRAWFPQDYSGYYLDSTLNFNSEDKWNSDSNPSTAPGYQGCSIDDDYISWSAKRQGFPCGVYTIDILSHDDDAQLYIDGVIVWEHINGCCDQHFGVWTGALNASSKVEFRVDEMSGDDVGALQFTLQSGNADFISVTGNPIVCTGQSYTLTSALLGTYEWSDGQTTNPAFATASGSYNVTVTDAAGCALTANPVSVTILAALAPVAHINASSNDVCDWNPVTLSSDSTIGNMWSTNETAQSISVSRVNLYTLTVTNNAGCFDESSIQINSGFTPPTPVATVSDTICAGSSATLSAGGLAPGGQVASFNGINQYVIVSQDIPEYDFTIEMWVKTTTANTGIFSVTDGYLGSNGHDRHIFLSNGQLSVRIYPSYSWNSGIQINDGQWHHIALTVQTGIGQKIYVDGIQSNFSNNDDHSDFDWQTEFNIGFSSDIASNFFNGQIDNVRIWSEARSQSELRNNMLSETPSSSTNLVYQALLNGNLDATAGSNGSAPNGITYTGADFYTYAWTGTGAPAAANSVTQTTAPLFASGAYSVTASAGLCGNSASASSNVVVLPSTEYYPDTDGDGFGDAGSPVVLLCAIPVSGYSLNNDDCNDALSSVHPGAIDICNSIDDNCNGITDENSVSAIVTAGGPTTFCSWSSVNLSASTSGAGSLSYQWLNESSVIPGATTTAYNTNVTGNYAMVISNGICTDTSNSMSVNVLAKPDAAITPSGIVSACKEVAVTFNANTGEGYTYQWYKGTVLIPGATTATHISMGSKQGYYNVLVTAPNGCYNHSDSTQLIRLNVPPSVINILNPADNPDLCINGKVKMRGTGGTGFTYLWLKNNVSTGVTTRDYTVTEEGNYKVQITNPYNCSKTSTAVSVFSSCRDNNSIATAVTPVMSVYPNPTDGHFAVSLSLFNSFNGDATVEVLNMLGQIVQSETVPVTDGELFKEMFMGKEMPAATYMLRIVADGQVFKEQVVVQY